MRIQFSDTHSFERTSFDAANSKYSFEIEYLDFRLTSATAPAIAPSDVVCSFVSDKFDRKCLEMMAAKGVKLLALRSAGFNHVDVAAAREFGITVCRVPSYSPHSVAEFAVGLMLSLNRKIHRAYSRVRELNFSLDGFVGFDLNGRTVGIVGAGKIGRILAGIMAAFGCQVLIFDTMPESSLVQNSKIKYATLEEVIGTSDIISLHVPLNPGTFHMIDSKSIEQMKTGVLLINTGRGALIESKALIEGLKSGKIGGAALDVYEEEEGVFFHDLSNSFLQDDTLARLISFPNVLITSHQAFLTSDSLKNIAETTLESIHSYRSTGRINPVNVV
ncbi:MAG: hydroxyacid dehydrogenase [Bdellovibrio sp. 28-41-41]|nr:MAG: hydroxyacid dehydrogenase [Bdellovibrio sp. 28-41-41]